MPEGAETGREYLIRKAAAFGVHQTCFILFPCVSQCTASGAQTILKSPRDALKRALGVGGPSWT